MGNDFNWRCYYHYRFLRAMAISSNTILEAHACALWNILFIYSLGHMVIRWSWTFGTDLVESIVALASFNTIWKFE